MKPKRNIRRWIGILILLVSIALLVWGFWPFGKLTTTLPITPSDMQLPTPQAWVPLLQQTLQIILS